MIYIPLWLKLYLLYLWKQKALQEGKTALYFFVLFQFFFFLFFFHEGPNAKRRGVPFIRVLKNHFPSYTNRKAEKRIYCIVSRVLHCTTRSG